MERAKSTRCHYCLEDAEYEKTHPRETEKEYAIRRHRESIEEEERMRKEWWGE
jgi:hypothetical protein